VNRHDFKLPKAFLSFDRTGPSDFFIPEIVFGGESLPAEFLHFDYAASTPLHRQVYEAMLPWLVSYFGNPASQFHAMGKLALHALQEARMRVATHVGVPFENAFFTSSATESNNLILRGLVESVFRKRTHIIFAGSEHASIATTAKQLEKIFGNVFGIRAISLPLDSNGQIVMDEARRLINHETLCVCVMDVNNETGIVQSRLRDVVELAHASEAWVHVDAVQGFVRGDFAAKDVQWDSLTVSSGKIYGPRGAALLALRNVASKRVLEPQLTGGGHEFGMRSSTVNVAAIVGFAQAMDLQRAERDERNSHLSLLEKVFLDELRNGLEFRLVGENAPRVPGLFSVIVDGVNPLKLVENARRIAVGTGSACHSLHASASHVLLAMGYASDEAMSSFRVSFGVPSTSGEASEGARLIAHTANRMMGKLPS
jgi:cysteine desulfurase